VFVKQSKSGWSWLFANALRNGNIGRFRLLAQWSANGMKEMSKRAFLAEYKHDIFVSYAHEDELGNWTVTLHEDLRRALNLILYSKLKGTSVDVWIDEILRNNLPLTDQLKSLVEGSALLLVIMSPYYLASSWCGREVEWFSSAARSRIAPHQRIFVVHAMPTDRASWPGPLAELTPYCFFARHLKANVELPLGLIGDDEDRTAYKAVLYNLAGQIRQQIEDLLAESRSRLAESSEMMTHRAGLQPAPTPLVCIEVLGASAENLEVTIGVRNVLKAAKVDIFSPTDLGVAPRDPLFAERFLQKLLRAKASCDGLVLLRLSSDAPIGDWLLDYVSEVRPMATRIHADRAVPPALLIEGTPVVSGINADTLQTLRFDSADFAERLTSWVNNLRLTREQQA
jgi:TIR domain